MLEVVIQFYVHVHLKSIIYVIKTCCHSLKIYGLRTSFLYSMYIGTFEHLKLNLNFLSMKHYMYLVFMKAQSTLYSGTLL